MEKVLLFFSGGNDSTLSACKLALEGYDVYLITFDNGCEEEIENIRNRAVALEKRFPGRVHNLGVYSSAADFMMMRYQSSNIPFSKILEDYGDLNSNQLNCLNCRSGMYIVGAAVARRIGINYIAEGARKTQMFALEQKELLDRFASILEKYNIKLLLPVYDFESDGKVEDELWYYPNILMPERLPGTNHYECKCFLGLPMDKPLSEEEINAYGNFFDDKLSSVISKHIEEFPNMVIDEQLKEPIYTRIRFK